MCEIFFPKKNISINNIDFTGINLQMNNKQYTLYNVRDKYNKELTLPVWWDGTYGYIGLFGKNYDLKSNDMYDVIKIEITDNENYIISGSAIKNTFGNMDRDISHLEGKRVTWGSPVYYLDEPFLTKDTDIDAVDFLNLVYRLSKILSKYNEDYIIFHDFLRNRYEVLYHKDYHETLEYISNHIKNNSR